MSTKAFQPPSGCAGGPVQAAWSMERLLFERSIDLGLALDKLYMRRTCSSSLYSYLTFCQLHHLDIAPTPQTLSFYVTFICPHIEPCSVSIYLTDIVSELEPFYPNVHEARQSALVTRTLRGAMRRFSHSVRQKLPLTRADLLHVYETIPRPLSHDDLLFLSLLMPGFFGLLCLSELVQPDSSSARSSLMASWRHTAHIFDSSYQFTIPRFETDSLSQGEVVSIQQSRTHPDPLETFTCYLTCHDLKFHIFPHLWLRADGSFPRRSWFLDRLRSFFPRAIGGRSLRAGGAISLAIAGVPLSEIQAMGHWNSSAFERYIRRHPAVLQAFLSQGRSVYDPPFVPLA